LLENKFPGSQYPIIVGDSNVSIEFFDEILKQTAPVVASGCWGGCNDSQSMDDYKAAAMDDEEDFNLCESRQLGGMLSQQESLTVEVKTDVVAARKQAAVANSRRPGANLWSRMTPLMKEINTLGENAPQYQDFIMQSLGNVYAEVQSRIVQDQQARIAQESEQSSIVSSHVATGTKRKAKRHKGWHEK
jgi:hypothetical protein